MKRTSLLRRGGGLDFLDKNFESYWLGGRGCFIVEKNCVYPPVRER